MAEEKASHEKLERLDDEGLDSISGGEVIRYNGKFYVCRIDPFNYTIKPLAVYDNQDEAIHESAVRCGDTIISDAHLWESQWGEPFETYLKGFEG